MTKNVHSETMIVLKVGHLAITLSSRIVTECVVVGYITITPAGCLCLTAIATVVGRLPALPSPLASQC